MKPYGGLFWTHMELCSRMHVSIWTLSQMTPLLCFILLSGLADPSPLGLEEVFFSPEDQTAREGEGVFFQCVSGESSAPPSITWFKDETLVTRGRQIQGEYGGGNERKTSGTLHLYNVTLEDDGTYVCVTYNPSLNISRKSRPAKLTVLGVPQILQIVRGPDNITVATGTEVFMHCAVRGFPVPMVHWFKDSILLNTSSSSFDLQNNGQLLTFRNVTREDQGPYHCEASNQKESIRSQTGFLLPAEMDWSFIQQPTNLTVKKGDNVTVTCRPPYSRPAAQVSWFRNNKLLAPTMNHVTVLPSGDLFFHSVQEQDSGSYFCRASNPLLQRFLTSRRAALTVLAAPSVKVFPQVLTVPVGARAVLECQVQGQPLPSIRWVKRGHSKQTGGRISLGLRNSTLHIQSARSYDEGVYVCEASSGLGKSQSAATLRVAASPVIVTITAQVSCRVGAPAVLPCKTVGILPITYSWSRGGADTQSPISSTKERHIDEEGALHILNVQFSDAGDYYCTAENRAGRHQRRFVLSVTAEPRPADRGEQTGPRLSAITSSNKDPAASQPTDSVAKKDVNKTQHPHVLAQDEEATCFSANCDASSNRASTFSSFSRGAVAELKMSPTLERYLQRQRGKQTTPQMQPPLLPPPPHPNFQSIDFQPHHPPLTDPPVTDPPVTDPPVTGPPVTDPPVTDPPVTGPPVTDPPVTDPPVTGPPVTDPPVTDPPVTDPPVTDPPVTDPPVTDPPVTDPPVTDPPVTDPPVTDPPVTDPPVTDPPVTGPPVTDPPVTGPPVTGPPVTDPPVTDPPVTNPPPVTDPPVTDPPVTGPPVTGPPVTDPPVTGPPVTDPPVTNPPVTDPPVTGPPVTDPPVTDPPVTGPPVTDPPVTDPPVTDPPVTGPPVTGPPVTDPPVTDPPVTDAPLTGPPVTDPPVTDPPVTDPPVTGPPVTGPPVTDPPVTDAPVTDPPVTGPPVTDPPVTDPPVTDPPVTGPPVTDPPVTDPPVTDAPVTGPPVTGPPVTDPPITERWQSVTTGRVLGTTRQDEHATVQAFTLNVQHQHPSSADVLTQASDVPIKPFFSTPFGFLNSKSLSYSSSQTQKQTETTHVGPVTPSFMAYADFNWTPTQPYELVTKSQVFQTYQELEQPSSAIAQSTTQPQESNFHNKPSPERLKPTSTASALSGTLSPVLHSQPLHTGPSVHQRTQFQTRPTISTIHSPDQTSEPSPLDAEIPVVHQVNMSDQVNSSRQGENKTKLTEWLKRNTSQSPMTSNDPRVTQQTPSWLPVLEKHDIPIVVGVGVSLAFIFITVTFYSVVQKNEPAPTSRAAQRNLGVPVRHTERRAAGRTYENRAFEDDDCVAVIEQSPNTSDTQARPPGPGLVTVQMEPTFEDIQEETPPALENHSITVETYPEPVHDTKVDPYLEEDKGWSLSQPSIQLQCAEDWTSNRGDNHSPCQDALPPPSSLPSRSPSPSPPSRPEAGLRSSLTLQSAESHGAPIHHSLSISQGNPPLLLSHHVSLGLTTVAVDVHFFPAATASMAVGTQVNSVSNSVSVAAPTFANSQESEQSTARCK